MPLFVVERTMPGIGKLGEGEMKSMCQGPYKLLREFGPDVQWVHSYVTDDKFFCIFQAANADLIRQHAKKAGIPADVVTEVRSVFDPATAG